MSLSHFKDWHFLPIAWIVMFIPCPFVLKYCTVGITGASDKLHTTLINSSPPEQNGHHFADYILRCIFMNE